MRATWLPTVLRAAGLEVIEHGVWRGRGVEMASIDAVIVHETITPTTAPDTNVANLLRDGHSTLKGPLAQLGLDRQGRFWMIADAKCNHNGYGTYGNNAIGIEAFNDGKTPWTPVQRSNAERGAAAILRHQDLIVSRCLGHKESDPGRKTDPHFDMVQFRTNVATQGDDEVTEADLMRIIDGVADEVIKRLSEDTPTSKAADRLKKAAHASQHLHDHAGLTD